MKETLPLCMDTPCIISQVGKSDHYDNKNILYFKTNRILLL